MDITNLAYTPLDIDAIPLNYHELDDLMSKYSLPHHPYPHIWDAFAVCGRITAFDDATDCDKAWNDRYILDGDVQWNPHLTFDLQEKCKSMLDALPYLKYTFAQILSQKIDVAPHQDGLYDPTAPVRAAVYGGADGFNGEPEPAGLKVMLSHKNIRSFYLSERAGSKRNFIKIPDDTNSFACNERKYYHGAKHPGEKKYILSTFGIIDRTRHTELIERSVRKYNEYTIWF